MHPSNRHRRKLSFFCSDLADNALVRVYPIVKVLSRINDVEVLGPLFGENEIFTSYAQELKYLVVHAPPVSTMTVRAYIHLWRNLIDKASGDVIYAFKPVLASYGAALLSKLLTQRPIILDIEDWDAYPFHAMSWRGRASPSAMKDIFRDQFSPTNLGLMEALTGFADCRVVSSTFLQRKYGGRRVVQGVDCTAFNPNKFDKDELRAKFGFSRSQTIVLFSGVMHPHKGVAQLVNAVKQLNRSDITIVVVGPYSTEAEHLSQLAGGLLKHLGPKPHYDIPKYLAIADLVCLPQLDTLYAHAQTPAKVFEAMAMEKGIIASSVSDLPEIIDGCGVIVPPGDTYALSEAIERLIDNVDLRVELGKAARNRCVENYSWDAMESPLNAAVDSIC